MKNNKLWLIIALLIILCIGIGIYFFLKNSNSNNSNYQASKISNNNSITNNNSISDNNNNDNINNNSILNNNENNASNNNIENTNSETNSETNSTQNSTDEAQKKEEAIASFTTKIYNKEYERQNNVSITCSTLNNTIVENGNTFSFCKIVGPATSAKGYQKADIFDNDGNKKKGLGGGNCQVSTTLYNAVLKVPSLQVTERHEHSNKVPYIQQGKDAAVAYGSYDLKFKNNTGFDIKISASSTKNNVSISIYKIIPNQ